MLSYHCTVHCIAAAPLFTLCLKHSTLVPVSLRPTYQKTQSALIGQVSEAWAETRHRVSAGVLMVLACMAEGSDCFVATSKTYETAEGSFKGAVSEYGRVHFLVNFDTFTVFI